MEKLRSEKFEPLAANFEAEGVEIKQAWRASNHVQVHEGKFVGKYNVIYITSCFKAVATPSR